MAGLKCGLASAHRRFSFFLASLIFVAVAAKTGIDDTLDGRLTAAESQLDIQTAALTLSVDVSARSIELLSPSSPPFNQSEVQRILFQTFQLFPETVEPAIWTTFVDGVSHLRACFSLSVHLPQLC